MRRYRSLKNTNPMRASRGAPDARERQERKDADAARARANGRCEVTISAKRCPRRDAETHHVIKRSQGGKYRGTDYLIRVCRECHSLTDAATTQRTILRGGPVYGRLMIVALGAGTFRCWMETDSMKRKDAALTERLRAAAETAARALEAPARAEADTFHHALRVELRGAKRPGSVSRESQPARSTPGEDPHGLGGAAPEAPERSEAS